MKNIKFRAWSEDTCEMVQVARLDIKEETIHYENGIKSLNREQELGFWWKPYVLMQYTGLNDKNGVEIYEGDIIKTHFYSNPYVDECGGFHEPIDSVVTAVVKNEGVCIPVLLADYQSVEVIGNVYEHKYLLREEGFSDE